jgi:hypothetical protein
MPKLTVAFLIFQTRQKFDYFINQRKAFCLITGIRDVLCVVGETFSVLMCFSLQKVSTGNSYNLISTRESQYIECTKRRKQDSMTQFV